MLVGLTLVIMLMLTVLSVVMGSTFASSIVSSGVDNELIINGTVTDLEIDSYDYLFNIDPVLGSISILILIVTVASIIGISVLGSGLSSSSVKIIVFALAYAGLWAILSTLTLGLISSIEVFGSVIYVSLTIGYIVGVIQKLSGGGDI